MLFDEVIGQDFLKKELIKGLSSGRIAHSQLFLSREGTGGLSLAIAYARMIIEKDNQLDGTSLKLSELKHPDLHFIYPVAINKDVKSKPISSMFLESWREFVHKNPYGNLFDWYLKIGVENKQGKIGKDEVEDIVKKMSLKSYEGGWKVAIIWMAEKLNLTATNKLLKLIEEPPKKTLFIFVCETTGLMAETLLSRCQTSKLSLLSTEEIETFLIKKGVEKNSASSAANNSLGNLRIALKSINDNENNKEFEEWFLKWVRTAFKVRKNKEEVLELINWSKMISKTGREVQKNFLSFSMNIFRSALLKNYEINSLVSFNPKTDMNFESFSKYVNGNNIEDIFCEIEEAHKGIEANGNANMIFMDLSLKLTRLIQKQ
ncbi:DNA polymerase III subunit delta' [Flavobacteriaceae bacterium]|nr:DNA polymerase III subunit delta' [Flavobacteriaceae bacterium]MDB4097273.1 DNA polymerase III subunit delta' [Flavobacteriaceae bacterium]